MSGYSESTDCPRCGTTESLERSIDHDDVSGECLECGYEYHVVHSVMSLEDINEERKSCEMEPITELKKPIEGWIDEEI